MNHSKAGQLPTILVAAREMADACPVNFQQPACYIHLTAIFA